MESSKARSEARWRQGVQWKLVALGVGAVLANALLLSVVLGLGARSRWKQDAASRLDVQVRRLVDTAAPLVAARDKAGLERLSAALLADNGEVAYFSVDLPTRENLVRAVRTALPTTRPLGAELQRLGLGGGLREQELAGLVVLEQSAPVYAVPDPKAAVAAPEARPLIAHVRVGYLATSLRRFTLDALGLGLALGLLCALAMGGAAYAYGGRLARPYETLAACVASLAAGDLRQRGRLEGIEELGELGADVDKMTAAMRSLVEDLQSASVELEREAGSILATAQQQSSMVKQQVSSISETSATSSEIAQTSKQATEYAESVIKTTQRAEELSHDGQQVVEESVNGMEKLVEQVHAIALSITELSDRTLQIGNISTTVKDLAEKSNMVALNASIEAARAGEQGRGFAIVAMEMRNLAERSKVAAEQIRTIIGEVQKGTRAAVLATDEGSKRANATITLAQSAGATINQMAQAGRETSLAARQIANNSRQQTTGVEQMVTAITDQSKAMADSLENSKRIEQVVANVSTVSKRLSTVVSRYRTE